MLPADQFGHAGCFPGQGKSEARHRRIADEVHIGMVLVAWLMIVLLYVFFFLIEPPGLAVSLELHAFVDREGWDSDPSHAEVIGAIKMASFRARIRTNREPELFRGSLDRGVKRSPLGPGNLDFFRCA